ncbi:MAG: 3-dehydroquinate synthase II [Candidatus Lokiarchaeota archaeon]|nr:3-dehydroquinate synthase II [Candidatus Lokiarchaeota archaeon]
MKKIILRLEGEWREVKDLASEAVINGFNHFIVRSEQIPRVKDFGNLHLYSYNDEHHPEFLIKKISDRRNIEITNYSKFGYEIPIKDKKDEETIIKLSEKSPDFIITRAEDWMIIPLENLIANLHNKSVELYADVKDIKEVPLALEILEIGTDGVVFTPKTIDDILDLKDIIKEEKHIKLSKAKIVDKKEVGSGDRVCIDTCSLLDLGEGMLIGSQSRGLFLIHAETIETEFVSSRPFRVNAGSVSAYILLPSGKTQYLSEIETGNEVLIVNNEGNCRNAIVGRSKIENRPMMLIKAKINDDIIKIIVQNAETIRLVRMNGEPISISRLEVGDEILVYYQKGGRHFGTLIDETIIEK